MAVELTTCYSDRARSQAASDWRVESRTNGRNFGDRRVMISYGAREAAGRAGGGGGRGGGVAKIAPCLSVRSIYTEGVLRRGVIRSKL